ncbi:hypothetical protein FB99_11800 [Pantoea agglomerans]|nr:hypothetical protein FB99_11800 [Pantoea agglomerans]
MASAFIGASPRPSAKKVRPGNPLPIPHQAFTVEGYSVVQQ